MRQGASGKRQVKERRETGLFWKKKSRDAYYGTPAKLQLKPVTQSTMHGVLFVLGCSCVLSILCFILLHVLLHSLIILLMFNVCNCVFL
jgi:hypothetical protein